MNDRGKWHLNRFVVDLGSFRDPRLQGGFIFQEVDLADASMVDAIGRETVAQIRAGARNFRLLIRSGMSGEELFTTLYQEMLEAASVAVPSPLAQVGDSNELDLERAACEARERWGNTSPANLNPLLPFHGFGGIKV